MPLGWAGLRARTLERKREATRAKIRARMNAVHLLVVSVPLEHCSELAYERIEKLAANMSASIMRQTSQYKVHGHFGLFNRAYRHVKTRFIWERLCSAKPPQTICETGFNAGLSALLMLEAAPDARLISFDLGDMAWSRIAAQVLKSSYPERFLGVEYGYSEKTIPRYAAAHPTFRCDAMLIDGGKSRKVRSADIENLHIMSRRGTRLFLDEVPHPCAPHL